MNHVISAEQAKILMDKGAQLLDVRSELEFKQGAKPGALNIPLPKLPHNAKNMDTSKPVIVYCRTGGRSAQAQMLLENMGFQNVHNAGSLNNL